MVRALAGFSAPGLSVLIFTLSSMHDRNESESRSPKVNPKEAKIAFRMRSTERVLRAIGAHLERLGRAAALELEKPPAFRKKIYTRTLQQKTGFKFGSGTSRKMRPAIAKLVFRISKRMAFEDRAKEGNRLGEKPSIRVKVKERTHDYFERKGLKRPSRELGAATVNFNGQKLQATSIRLEGA
jgi:hypothetical protein